MTNQLISYLLGVCYFKYGNNVANVLSAIVAMTYNVINDNIIARHLIFSITQKYARTQSLKQKIN